MMLIVASKWSKLRRMTKERQIANKIEAKQSLPTRLPIITNTALQKVKRIRRRKNLEQKK